MKLGVDAERHLLIENSIFGDVRLRAPAGGSCATADSVSVPFERGLPLILYAGTFEPYQGVEVLVQAFARVRTERPDARLLLVGGSDPQIRSLRALADSLGLGDTVLLTGRVAKSTVALYTQAASVLVSPRLHGSNTPLKIYEQIASGRTLVATRVRSHTQVLDETVCCLVDPDPAALAGGLLEVLNDPRRSGGARAQRIVLLPARILPPDLRGQGQATVGSGSLMCGIGGIVALSSAAPDRAELERMCSAMVYRGPDDEGLLIDGPVGLGMRRLSIIDVAGGHQPIFNEDGTVAVVFNGEIYNYRELGAMLEAKDTIPTASDTEVIVHLWEEVGIEFPRRLSGMFAIALYDRVAAPVVLARDHVGIKPLYYALSSRRARVRLRGQGIAGGRTARRGWTSMGSRSSSPGSTCRARHAPARDTPTRACAPLEARPTLRRTTHTPLSGTPMPPQAGPSSCRTRLGRPARRR